MTTAAATSPEPGPSSPPPRLTLKIVIAGGLGAGKTTLVNAISEIPPLSTEEQLTCHSAHTDSLQGVETKTTTTVALDFGRITFETSPPMELFLFGTPGQDRFLFHWDELSYGAIGAVVLCDTRRLCDSFPAVDYFEQRLPFVVAVNQFDGTCRYSPDVVREALELPAHVPVVVCDAREHDSVRDVLVALVNYVLWRGRPDNHRAGADQPPASSVPEGAHP